MQLHLQDSKATGLASTVIPGTLLYLNGQILIYIAVNLLAVMVAFVLTWLFGYSDKCWTLTKTGYNLLKTHKFITKQ